MKNRILAVASLTALLCMPTVLAQPQMPPASVVVQSVEKMLMSPTVPVTGTVYSRDDVQITIGVEGQLEYVAEPGTRVKKGTVIARIDTTQLELNRAEQEAQAERARAQLKFLDAQLRRQQDLADTNVLAANELEQTQSQRDVAASDLRIAEVRLKQIDDQLRRAVVQADFAGVITERMRNIGEDVTRGTIVARLLDTDRLEVRVLAPLRYQGRIQPGDTLRLFGYEREMIGTVRSMVPATDPRQQAIELRIDINSGDINNGDINNSDAETQPWSVGELVSVAIPLRSASEVLAVPRDALILRQEGSYVFRVSKEGTAERIAVVIGDSTGAPVELKLEDTVQQGRGQLWTLPQNALCAIPKIG
ncbi:MAG: efflux RND transporter periplasmic adaptor subunit, partial [Proteobacteria bacterium]|nr:efflux RND transporter periplasmic adaptor subunit [Pseudomonadota bacterium]